MIKPVRRPITLTIALLVIIALIYTISGNSNDVQGMTPLNLNKKLEDYGMKNQIPESQPQDNAAAPKLGGGYSEESILDDTKEILTDHHEEEVEQQQKQEEKPVELSKDSTQNPQMIGELSTDFTDTPFMPKMANETLKAQLGNSAWRLFHTILARYPEKPSKQEQTTLNLYIHLFAQVYPCGDCARHFQGLLQKYPPQTKNRKTAALWGCHVHNKVNERLSKPEYDCTTILEDYDCGCGSDEQEEDSTLANKSLKDLNKVDLQEEEEQLGG